FAIRFLFLLSFQTAIGQVEPADTTSKPILSKLQADSLREPIYPLPYVGSIDRSVSQVITDSAMNFIDYRHAGDLLYLTPGLFVRELGIPGQLDGFTIGGLDSRSIAFMSDGISLTDPLTGTYNP